MYKKKENVQHYGESTHLTEPSCWLCHRSLGSYLCSQACLVPKQMYCNQQFYIPCQKATHRHQANLVVESMVKHQPELLPGHIGVGVHHLEPIHVPVQGCRWIRKWTINCRWIRKWTIKWFLSVVELFIIDGFPDLTNSSTFLVVLSASNRSFLGTP